VLARVAGLMMTSDSQRGALMSPRARRIACLAAFALSVACGLDAQAGRGSSMAIIGRVFAPDGRPVSNTFVTALKRPTEPGKTFSFVDARLHAITNSQGEFRLEGLYAGEFFLVALPRNTPGAPRHTGLGNTFHPNVASFATLEWGFSWPCFRFDWIEPPRPSSRFDKTLLGLTVFLPLFPWLPCSYQCTRSPGHPGEFQEPHT